MFQSRFGVAAVIFVISLGIAIAIEAQALANDSRSAKHGELLFDQSCASCHDAHSQKKTVGPGLKGYMSHGKAFSDETTREIILHGRGTMPGFGTLSPREVDDLVSYLRTL